MANEDRNSSLTWMLVSTQPASGDQFPDNLLQKHTQLQYKHVLHFPWTIMEYFMWHKLVMYKAELHLGINLYNTKHVSIRIMYIIYSLKTCSRESMHPTLEQCLLLHQTHLFTIFHPNILSFTNKSYVSSPHNPCSTLHFSHLHILYIYFCPLNIWHFSKSS